tara:strand:+ start:121 stop:1062 length:942 start_codon:yes stop_codon:yes gene_type:complete
MSEIETTPETSVDSASVESVDTSVESVDSVDSTPDLSAETSSDVSDVSDEVGSLSEELAESVFDHENWDGNIDGLPDTLREPVRFLHRQLEGGYTKKFQTLAQERRRFDANRQQWDDKYGTWKDEKEAADDELTLLRNLLDGMEDPRLSEFQETNSGLRQNLSDMQSEFENYKAIVEKDIQEQAQVYAKQYREKYSDIFKSEEKRGELSKLLDTGFDPESAAKLVGQGSEVLSLARKLVQQGTPSGVAVEHALIKAGNPTKRTPRPGARLTSGAESRNNPESIKQSVNSARDPSEARTLAARAAINWQKKKRV